jgi:hypothetical protein
MTWGLCVSAVGSLAMCTTLAEICHVYPTVGGQYDWAYVLAPEGYRRGLAWIAGWMTAVSETRIRLSRPRRLSMLTKLGRLDFRNGHWFKSGSEPCHRAHLYME